MPAFTRPTGKHRARSRTTRRGAGIAGLATLTVGGVMGTLSSPALATGALAPRTAPLQEAGLDGALVLSSALALDDTLADTIDAQAVAQREAADRAAKAEALAKAEARARAAAKAEAERDARARAKEVRGEKQRAARAAERRRLGSFRPPVAGSYVSTGYRTGGSLWSSGSHTGVDFHAASGTPVVAVGAGTVVEAGWSGAYGNSVVLRMADGMYTQYGHLSSLGVSVGQAVAPGQRIGHSGATGNTTGPHLHFEARTSAAYGTDIDPVAYLRTHGVDV
ncbi:M23 family metallopeptidase [Streptomyces sp. NPDC087420]|uniref:M23 family metallopeptidase n=1 Tax=Streptomyces sp. NPDC087420 TaxID=3365785 RepID=UPI003835B478